MLTGFFSSQVETGTLEGFNIVGEGEASKGQLISKCTFDVFKSTKKPMKSYSFKRLTKYFLCKNHSNLLFQIILLIMLSDQPAQKKLQSFIFWEGKIKIHVTYAPHLLGEIF